MLRGPPPCLRPRSGALGSRRAGRTPPPGSRPAVLAAVASGSSSRQARTSRRSSSQARLRNRGPYVLYPRAQLFPEPLSKVSAARSSNAQPRCGAPRTAAATTCEARQPELQHRLRQRRALGSMSTSTARAVSTPFRCRKYVCAGPSGVAATRARCVNAPAELQRQSRGPHPPPPPRAR